MEYDSRSPIYLQVIDRIKKRMVQRDIKPGDRMPSTRMLALEYGVNPNTAARIYDEMETMGLCYTERGLGTFMVNDSFIVQKIRKEMASQLTREFVSEMAELGFSLQDMKFAIDKEMKS
jgi:DNA-binding transcriptional regulator YhcF (GntR family)